jgi:hypothetical protein
MRREERMTNERRQRILCVIVDDDGRYYYNGPLDGIWGPESQAAAERFLRDFTGEETAVPEEENGTFWDEIKFFTREEFRCKCGGKYCDGFPAEPKEAMVRIADRLRQNLGVPITVVSGLRCPQWNAIQGGVENSQHKFGEALDVYFYGVTPDAALAWLQSQSEVRYAYRIAGCDNIHFDIYPVGR